MPTLKDFQREDVDYIKKNGLRCLIANSPGTGKTAIALSSLIETCQTSFPAVVVCPASVTHNWAKECKMWAPGIKPVVISDGTEVLPKRGPNTLYIVSWALLDARWESLARRGIKTLIADEVHFAKEADTIRTMALAQLAKRTPHVLLLSGTPIINNVGELEAIKSLFGTSEPPMIRRLLEDVVPEIPPKTRSYIHVSLREEDQQYYDNAVADFENWLRNERRLLEADGMSESEIQRALLAEALTKIGYLRRIAGEAKSYAALEWIARAVRLGEPVVIFMEHQAVVKKISRGLKKMKIEFRIIEGATSSKDRQEAIDGFQNNDFPVLLCSKAGKEGITLTAARHLMFVERFYTSAEEEQAEDRIRRIGQKFRTNIWFLHAVNTIDDRLDTIVKNKRQIIRTAIGAANTAETEKKNVEGLLSAWHNFTTPTLKVLPLGHGVPLPPLPKGRDVHAIVFGGARWNPRTAAVWCRMNGYAPEKRQDEPDQFRLLMNPIEYFIKGSFKSFRISKDVKLILGKRVSKAYERKYDSARKRMAG